MRLTAKAIAALKYDGKTRRVFDGHGLYVEVTATGKKFRYRYRLHGKQREYTIGDTRDYTLAEARERHATARKQVLDGIDPIEHRRSLRAQHSAIQAAEQARAVEHARTFRVATADFLTAHDVIWSENTRKKESSRMKLVPDWFGDLPCTAVTDGDMQRLVDELAKVNRVNAAYRVRRLIRRVLDAEKIQSNPARSQITMPPRPRQVAFRYVADPSTVGDVLLCSREYPARIRSVWLALQVLPRMVCRPTELSTLRWRDIDFDSHQIIVPGERMKSGNRHSMSIPAQVQALLIEHRDYVHHAPDDLVFPGGRSRQPYSNNTLNAAYREMGFDVTGHGWRHTFSTLVTDGRIGHYHPEAIEAQLAHQIPGIRGAYTHSTRRDERVRLMQDWSDYLDTLIHDAKSRRGT